VRYFFHIGFNGRNYRGWQRQAMAHNIQQVVEERLSQILKTSTVITGCGRTDAQVHASQFFFHVDIEKPWDFDLIFRINKTLPDDIAVFDIFSVAEDQHARFDAVARTYDYFIHTYKNPFINTVSTLYLEKNLNLGKMKQAVSLLPLYQDYRALCKSPDNYRTTICKVKSALLMTDEAGDHIRFQVTADRFLGKMIRIIVGKLLLIGKGELSVDEFESYLITKKTPETFEPAFAQGLFLSKVTYPFLDIPPRSNLSTIIQAQVDSWQIV
jgi:tRNA pseudouridine38-40 synthase